MPNLALGNEPEADEFDEDDDLDIDDVASNITVISPPETLQEAKRSTTPNTTTEKENENQVPPTQPVPNWHSDELEEEIEEPPTAPDPYPAHQVDTDGNEITTEQDDDVVDFSLSTPTGSVDEFQFHPDDVRRYIRNPLTRPAAITACRTAEDPTSTPAGSRLVIESPSTIPAGRSLAI